jgi:hypothetical protein
MYFSSEESLISRKAMIWRSTNNGESWQPLNDLPNAGLPSSPEGDYTGGGISSLVSGPMGQDGSVTLYATISDGKGVYRYTDYPTAP